MKKPCRKSGKIKFDSHEKAAVRAGEILDKCHDIKELRTYLCGFCQKWHLTSSAPRKKIKMESDYLEIEENKEVNLLLEYGL